MGIYYVMITLFNYYFIIKLMEMLLSLTKTYYISKESLLYIQGEAIKTI